MNIITVIPITKSKVAETLSYFTSHNVEIGSIVSVPLRSKTIHAIVLKSVPAQDEKVNIKSAGFEIRKLRSVKSSKFFSKKFMDSVSELAEFYCTNPGTVIKSLVSSHILDAISNTLPSADFAPLSSANDTYAVQGDDADRISAWRSLIRQEFAKKRSLVIYVPSIEDSRYIYSSISKGIEDYLHVLHGGLTQKKVVETWHKISESEHPVVVIATPSFSILPRSDISTVIIERENGRGWVSQSSPYIDMRHAIETIARNNNQTVFLSDIMLRIETQYRLEKHEITEGSPMKRKTITTSECILIDMKSPTPVRSSDEERPERESKKFRTLSPELESLISKNRDESAHLFILTGRRGLATLTVCEDCETVVSCAQCGSPVVLHASKAGGRNFFMCHRCGSRRPADESCLNCGSWRLNALGIGTERVASEIREKFPGIDLFVIDSDAAHTEKQIASALQSFRNKPGSILLGTETALLHLDESVDHSAVVSLDFLLALPDFRAEERMMYILSRMRNMTTRKFLVQTRRADEHVFNSALTGNLADFYRQTIDQRKQFSYPPFSTLIKISIEGKKESIAEMMAKLREEIGDYELDVFPAYTAVAKGASAIHGLIKANPASWPDPMLVDPLKRLPPNARVKVNPESLL